MSDRRLDVRRRLQHLGWIEKADGCLIKGDAVYGFWPPYRDSMLSAGSWTIDFGGQVPVQVIVAACQAAA
jgi:hypothetical protein